jgi:hypothetical protein
VADLDAAGGEHLLDHPKAQRKAEIEPDRQTDHLSGEAVAGIQRMTGLGPEQDLLSMIRRHYQPNTATFETRSIPPVFVRRISRPMAKRKTAGSWSAGGILAHNVLVTGRPLRVRRGA